jgi:hypothetical protein
VTMNGGDRQSDREGTLTRRERLQREGGREGGREVANIGAKARVETGAHGGGKECLTDTDCEGAD